MCHVGNEVPKAFSALLRREAMELLVLALSIDALMRHSFSQKLFLKENCFVVVKKISVPKLKNLLSELYTV